MAYFLGYFYCNIWSLFVDVNRRRIIFVTCVQNFVMSYAISVTRKKIAKCL